MIWKQTWTIAIWKDSSKMKNGIKETCIEENENIVNVLFLYPIEIWPQDNYAFVDVANSSPDRMLIQSQQKERQEL